MTLLEIIEAEYERTPHAPAKSDTRSRYSCLEQIGKRLHVPFAARIPDCDTAVTVTGVLERVVVYEHPLDGTRAAINQRYVWPVEPVRWREAKGKTKANTRTDILAAPWPRSAPPEPVDKPCVRCGRIYVATNPRSKYCSASCRTLAARPPRSKEVAAS